jgi:hypothetical protein
MAHLLPSREYQVEETPEVPVSVAVRWIEEPPTYVLCALEVVVGA